MIGITLIGMPGSGKSTVGRQLSKKLGWRHVDLDDFIAERCGETSGEILRKKGQDELLRLEEIYTLELDLSKTVFAPGGSIVYSVAAMEKLQKETIIVLLEAPFEEIEKRVGENPGNERAIVGWNEKGLAKLFAERLPLLESYAHFSVSAFGAPEEAVADKILALIKI